MVTFVGEADVRLPKINDRLIGRIQFLSDTELPGCLIDAVEAVQSAILRQMEVEKKPLWNQTIICIFTRKDRITIELGNEVVALSTKLVVFPIRRMLQYGEDKLCADAAEELCHIIWDIKNEIVVKFKVMDILSHLEK